MSNSLIPYSFTPGAKAKAQEVNANFIALAEQIEDTREFTTTQINETVEKIEESNSATDNKKADKNLANTTLITNCILSAPNGVVESLEDVITVKEGLKVLIPNGRNEDDSLKSIEVEISEDTALSTLKNTYKNCVYVTESGCGFAEAYYQTIVEPQDKRGVWFNHAENKTYFYNTEREVWDELPLCVIAFYENAEGTVTNIKENKPLQLLRYNELSEIFSWMAPDYSKAVQKAWWTQHVAQQRGWVHVFSTTETAHWAEIYAGTTRFQLSWTRTGCQSSAAIMYPVDKGEFYGATGSCANSHAYVHFMPMKGEG